MMSRRSALSQAVSIAGGVAATGSSPLAEQKGADFQQVPGGMGARLCDRPTSAALSAERISCRPASAAASAAGIAP